MSRHQAADRRAEGQDVWRGREKSITDAIEAGTAGIGVDKLLLQRVRDKHATKS
jgi:hypothetical protein